MKKSLFAIAGLCVSTGNAWAQSSITPFGVVDLAVRQVRNQGADSVTSLSSGSNMTSRWGIRGSEDLGGGLKAGFWLEGGFTADTGATTSPSQLFDRQSYISLSSSQLGELRAGRDLTPVYTIWSAADVMGQVGVASVIALYPAASSTAAGPIRAAFGTNDRNATSTTRNNNMLAYRLPDGLLGGVNGSLFVAAGEGSTAPLAATSGHKQKGFTLGYASGPLSIRAGYALTNSAVTGNANDFKDRAFHAIYDFGTVKATVGHRQYKYLSFQEDIFQLGLLARFGAHTAKFSYGRLNNKGPGIDSLDSKLFGVGYQYDLSKRTVLYAQMSRLSNSGTSAVALAGGSTAGFTAGGRSTGFETGIRHSF